MKDDLDPYVSTDSASPEPAELGQPTEEERQFAMFTHLSGLVVLLGIPSVIGPVVLWMIKKDSMPFVEASGKQAINFHLTMTIAGLITWALCFVLVGFLILPFLGIWFLVFTILGAVRTNRGELYRYPLTIPFLS